MSTRQVIILTLLACSTLMLSFGTMITSRKFEALEARIEALELKLSEDIKP